MIIHCNYYSAFEVDGSEHIFLKLLVLLWSDETEFMKIESMPYTQFAKKLKKLINKVGNWRLKTLQTLNKRSKAETGDDNGRVRNRPVGIILRTFERRL